MKNNIAILFVLLSSLSLGAAKAEGEPPSPGRNDLKGLSAEAFVTWKGGPDLAVPYFIPPVIVNEDRSIITLQDNTANLGSTSATASVTRYYLSDVEPPFDLTMARVVGERTIPILEAGAESRGPEIIVPFPADLSGEIYYLAACADAETSVVELNEQNNCSYSQLNSPRQVNVVAAMPPPNQPPDCTMAATDIATLWPPNHKLVSVTITGVSDPDNDPLTLTIDTIQQDEPVNGLGDGDTSPDGFGLGVATAELRAERSGTGNGRVYIIGFTASDDKQASCASTVTVGVPHDKGDIPVDDGARHDSTQP